MPSSSLILRMLALSWALLTVHAAETPSGRGTPAGPADDPPPEPKAALVSSMDALDDQHRLAVGDRLSFRIVEDQEDPKSMIVTDLGDIEVPYLGRFPALGKTCKQLAQELKVELEKTYYYQATVIVAVDVLSPTRGRVYIFGQIRSPGPREIATDEVFTLSKAILMAGSFGDFADRKKVRVTRTRPDGAAQNYEINVALILEKGRTELDLVLEPGDLIFVPSRLINF